MEINEITPELNNDINYNNGMNANLLNNSSTSEIESVAVMESVLENDINDHNIAPNLLNPNPDSDEDIVISPMGRKRLVSNDIIEKLKKRNREGNLSGASVSCTTIKRREGKS